MGSFSWIPATDAYLLPGGKSIEITAKNCVSWIGSSLGTAKQYRWQVQLNAGEQLTKLGEETIKDKEGKDTLWYKVSPPNGEFRWIQQNAISRQPPQVLAGDKKVAENQVVPASGKRKSSANSTSGSVKSATHFARQESIEGVVVEDGANVEGSVIIDDPEYIDGQVYADGEVIVDDPYMIDGEYLGDGEVVMDGEYIEDDGVIVSEHVVPNHDANWNDWQLFEFTDAGLRFPLLERAAAWRKTQPDPLVADPFSLALAPKKRGQIPPGLPEPSSQPMRHRRHTPWRDPRELGQQRMQGYPQASGELGLGTSLSTLRGTFEETGEVFRDNFGGDSSILQSPVFSPPANAPSGAAGGGVTPQGQPQPAPVLGSPQANLAPPNSLMGLPSPSGPAFGSPNLFSAGAGQVDLPALPPDPFTSQGASGGAAASSGRNWFGLGNRQASQDRSGLLEASSGAVWQLQQRLSEMVTRPMQYWNFGELKQRVQYFIQNGSNPAERGQARLLLERIDEFERHAMRSGYSLSSLNSPAPLQGSSASAVNPGNTSNVTSAVVTASYTAPSMASPAMSAAGSTTMVAQNFDATGWLTPLFATQPGQPTHALKSDSGQIIAYVTAIPGMNLDRFVNQAVGIHGLRGYLNDFQAAHIEAQNITRLR